MSSWQRWLVLGAISAGLGGCGGGDDAKKGDPAPAAGGGGPPAELLAGPGLRGGGPPAVAEATAGGGSSSGGFEELLQFLPENLKVAAGANFAALNDKANAIGPRLLAQFQPATAALSRAGIKADQIERLWTGNNRETGDLLICVRTKEAYDAAAATRGMGVTGGGEKIGKATVQSLPIHETFKNAIAFVDPKTLLLGRYDSVAAALKNPKAGPVRVGIDAMHQPDTYYWIAGNESMARGWMGGGGGNVLGGMLGDSLRMRGMSVGFGGSFGSAQGGGPDDPSQFGRGGPGGMGRGGFPGAGMPGMPAASGASNVELALGMSFASEAVATSIETKLNQLLKGPGQGPGGFGPRGMGPAGGRRGYEFQPRLGRGKKEEDEASVIMPGRGPAGAGFPGAGIPGPGGGGPGGAGLGATLPSGAALLAQLGLQIQRDKQNLRIGMTIPTEGAPLIARFINDAITATGSSALADGIFDGTLVVLASGLREWPTASTEPLKGVRRFPEMRLLGGYSWMTDLLPFIGHQDLHTLFDFNKSWMDPDNLPHTLTVIPPFLNPADPRSTWDGYPEHFAGMGLTHFVGMSGIEDGRNVVAAELPRSDPRAGIFGYDEIARMDEVTDGTSQTIMMIGSGEVTAPWVQGGGATIRGARAPYFHKFTGFGSRGLARPGAFVLFADGSARTLSADIDPEVFKALCTMHGAEQIDLSTLAPPQQE